ncbi:MAG: ABC transporter ATP-binding protein [Anaeromicrobium sp.]|jgi:ABC-2 type transport system ATP-binding protein|nr:ABC transporter ATP-binding protein [Anaeromicrobium sp.]
MFFARVINDKFIGEGLDNMIKIQNITKSFQTFNAVDHLQLNIEKGTFVGLLGPNGAGKTTLIKMLVGLLKPTSGEILIKDEKMHRGNTFLKSKIGIVPQHINLDKELTVEENLIFAAKLYKIPKEKIKPLVEDLLQFSDLKGVQNRITKKLSGGMKRKLMIAKSLVNDPEILFLDEPTVGIDLNNRRKIWDILKKMKHKGKTIILTTHYMEEAEYLCDKIGLMDKGKIFYYDTNNNLKEKIGKYTIEYFSEDDKTIYKYFSNIDTAQEYAKELTCDYVLRNTNLEDVFFNFTNRKVL